MNRVYCALGTSKQAFHQMRKRREGLIELESTVAYIVSQVREDHPGMGLKSIWEMMQPEGIGRDYFIEMGIKRGLEAQIKRNPVLTTNSYGVTWFDNLLEGLKLKELNQVWVSDITYYRILERFYYITLIMDLFSRKIIGMSTSKTLRTEDTTIPALKYALKVRGPLRKQKITIFHSDGGGQYYSTEFKKIIKRENFKSSMGQTVYENAYAERVIGTIKNAYLTHWSPSNFEQLTIMNQRACLNYNIRPHQSLNKLSPNDFERKILHQNMKFSTFPQN